MKKIVLNPMIIIVLIIVGAIAIPTQGLRSEQKPVLDNGQNREEAAIIKKIRKDFTKVLREKKKPAEKHPRIDPQVAETGTTLHTPDAL